MANDTSIAMRSRMAAFNSGHTDKVIYIAISGSVVLLGLIREMVVAAHFGLSAEFDVYAAVFGFYLFFGNQVPNSIETTLISQFAGKKDIAVKQAIASSTAAHWVIFLCVSFIFIITGRPILAFLFGFEEHLESSFRIILAFMPAILFSGTALLNRAGLNIKNIFLPGMVFNSVVSIVVILSVIALQASLGILSIPIGYSGGALIMAGIMVYFVRQTYNVRSFKEYINLRALRAVFFSASFVLIGEVIFQVGFTVERALAVRISEGSVASFYYAIAFLNVFTTVFIVPFNTVFFPRLSKKYNQGVMVLKDINRVAGLMCLFGVIIAFLLYALSEDIVHMALVRGKFTAADAERTSGLLAVILYVFPFMSIGQLLRYCLIAMKDFRCAIWANSLRLAVIVLGAPVLIPNFGMTGLAYAYVAAGVVSVTFLLVRAQVVAKARQIN
jgi:peptidoglycan biosynthesis protein MviN/MurJ (putative lipid II flippase)